MAPIHSSRRAVLAASAWAAPTAAVSMAVPAFAASQAPNPQSDRIAIIGSGYGGAVAALRLAEAGYNVDVYEMGMDWQNSGREFRSMTRPDGTSGWFLERTDMPFGRLAGLEELAPDLINKPIPSRAGVLGIEYFEHMKVYVGKGIGGGSLVNGGMAVTPNQAFFSQVMPTVPAQEMFSTYFPRARAELGVREPQKDVVMNSQWYEFTRAGVRQGARAGIDHAWVPNVYDFNHMRREIYHNAPDGSTRARRSALDREVIFGNNAGKNDLTRTYWGKIRSRYAHKVTLHAMTEARSITEVAPHTYRVDFKEITFEGATVREYSEEFGHIVLAAGSVGTTRLLMNAKRDNAISGLASNPAIGSGWGPNGNVMFARRGVGITGGRHSTIPTMGLTTWDNGPNSVFAEIAPLPTGIDLQTSLYLAITNPSETGTFVPTADGHMALDWSSRHAADGVAAATAFAERLNQANGGSLRTDLFEGFKAFADYFTYHPLGGVVLDKATDNLGQVAGAPGIYAMDGSLIEAKIGVNPFVTITALAERNIEKLINAGTFMPAAR